MMMKIIMMGIMKIETSDNYNITKMIFIILVFLLWVVMLVFCFLITSCGMAYYRYKYNYVYDKNFIKPPNFVD
jgi:glucan phosphoethanolaminetransferase (alkaline phosphatase superfamily)